MPERDRRRIALLLASIHSGAAKQVWPGMVKQCERRRSSLFIFPGGRLESKDEFEYVRNCLFRLAGARGFDGALCWASSLSGYASETKVKEFLLSSIKIPLVTFGLKIDGLPVVNIDAYEGMRRLIRHMTQVHRCRRIAFIGGPREHSSAEERYRAYRDELRASRLPYDERIVMLDTPWTEGGAAIEAMLDSGRLVPGKDFDALCAASDLLAFEAVRVLQRRGFRVPGDLALGGFNDSEESNLLAPTFTTIRVPFERQGLRSLHKLFEILDGGQPVDEELKTRLIVRQSCGCVPESVRLAGDFAGSKWERFSSAFKGDFENAALAFAKTVSGLPPDIPDERLARIAASLAGNGKEGVSEFLSTFDLVLNDAIHRGDDLAPYQDFLSALRTAYIRKIPQRGSTDRLESALGQARVLAADAEKRSSNYRAWKDKEIEARLSVLSHELLCAKDFASIAGALARRVPGMGIASVHIVVSEPDRNRRRLMGGFETLGGEADAPRLLDCGKDGIAFPDDRLVPDRYLETMKSSYIVLPLYFETKSLGYAVLQAGSEDASLYEELRAQISSAIRGVMLFEESNEARKNAERAERVKTEFLAGITEELQEPIDSIHGIACAALEAGGAGREALEAIARHSVRQKELTRQLLDLSLAQVNDFALDFSLNDPEVIARDFISGSGSSGPAVMPAVLPDLSGDGFPLVECDTKRVAQVLSIFLDALSTGIHATPCEFRTELRVEGVAFIISRTPASLIPRKSLDRLKEAFLRDSGQRRPDSGRIGIELAKRIAFFHGGAASIEGDANERISLALTLPWPTLAAEPAAERPSRPPQRVRILSGAAPGGLAALFQGGEPAVASITETADPRALPEDFGLAYIDPAHFPARPSGRCGDDAVASVEAFLDNVSLRRVPCFVPAGEYSPAELMQSVSLESLLRGRLPPKARDIVFLLRPFGGESREFEDLVSAISRKGRRILNVQGKDALGSLAMRGQPSLLVAQADDAEFLRHVTQEPETANVPLICVGAAMVDPECEGIISRRPRTIAINSGPLFHDAFAAIAEAILSGQALLPAPSASVVNRCVFLLNRRALESLSRWKLSESVNASEDYISRIFHRQMSLTLWEYLNRLRLSHSMHLLKTTAASLGEIAASSGYQDQAYFCRVFKRIVGVTPGTVRRGVSSDVRKVQ